ncbi:MAG: Gldg family protein, partial [Pirellulales bacterium]|nr:Gldg family protein [Pirellulales bacterium]
MNSNVLRAVFTRNFISYFTNPTGYVFICLFVWLSSLAAFWPEEFFISNLANLDQLNYYFPLIMLVFIPAITMSIWAEERREGTDELLLTVPSTDMDIVLGKYLAAVAIYTVSLLFSCVSSLIVLRTLGDPDVGLFMSTYLGYWLVGLGMLAIGMVASFITSNLTVAYVFGVLFNLPLIVLYYIYKTRLDIFDFGQAGNDGQTWILSLTARPWSIQQQLSDFARGVPTLSGVVYFGGIVVVMLYLSMILIGRRHWTGGSAFSTGLHYLIRVVSLAVVMLGIFTITQRASVHFDMTQEQLTSLSPHTVELLNNLETDKRPVRIDAFISPEVPEAYVQTRLNLINTLKEMQSIGGQKLDVVIHETKRFGEEATLADERFKIVAKKVTTDKRGAFTDDFIFLGVAFRCGLSPVTIPFFDRGTPIEYELIRSICTVAQQKRKTVGILTTDAQLYGQFNMQTMSPGRNWPIIDELEKQYEVVRVDPKQPIDTKKIDVLLAVQPSSLGPPEMDNFVAAIKTGLPTAIFEDPAPLLTPGVPPTSEPRQSDNRMAMMMGRQQSPPKGDINKLWSLLDIDFAADSIVWQKYNPYPKFSQFPDEF